MMMFDAVVLALVQGLTEFIPVSSSGHLLAVRLFFDISDDAGTSFDAFLHLGTLLAVVLYYRKTWIGILYGMARDDEEGRDKRELFAKISIATVPGAVLGYFFQGAVGDAWRSSDVLAGGLVLTAVALVVFDIFTKRSQTIHRASYWSAWLIGLWQVLALIPGVSRSGITIAAGRWRGLSRRQATHFSFLLSVPIIAGAGLNGLSALLTNQLFGAIELWVAFVVSFLSGWLAIYLLLKYVERISLVPFAFYLVGLAVLLLFHG